MVVAVFPFRLGGSFLLHTNLLRRTALCGYPFFVRFSSKHQRESLYSIFGVKEDCTHQQLKEAFYRLSKLYHPDLTDDPNARVKFQELARAYEILGNPERRKVYDRGLIQTATPSTRPHHSDITLDAIRHTGSDSFSSFYVKKYNRALGEAWFHNSDPELVMTTLEFRQNERNFLATFYYICACSLLIAFAYFKLTEEPVELLPASDSPDHQQ